MEHRAGERGRQAEALPDWSPGRHLLVTQSATSGGWDWVDPVGPIAGVFWPVHCRSHRRGRRMREPLRNAVEARPQAGQYENLSGDGARRCGCGACLDIGRHRPITSARGRCNSSSRNLSPHSISRSTKRRPARRNAQPRWAGAREAR